MSLQSLIPIRRASRREISPFAMLQREIDRLFDDFSRGLPTFAPFAAGDLTVRMDMAETDKDIELTVEVPGLEAKDVDISVAGDVLTIKGEKTAEKEEKGKDYRFVERSYGSFCRTVDLPAGIKPESVKATIANGVLKVTVPKPAAAEAKKIEVKAAA